MIGWESGDLYLFVEDTCLRVDTSHGASPIHLARWSARGNMLVTADKNGAVIGWRSDGAAQLDMVFHHELKDALTSVQFPPAPQPRQGDPEVSEVGKSTNVCTYSSS